MITLQQIHVPPEFRCHQVRPYPPDNFEPFEEWFGKNYDESRNNSDRVYLPIYWTSFYGNHRHGKDRRALRRLQEYIDRIDRSKKYFTVCQNDDGILNNVTHLDIKIFGMGCKGDVQLPLVCQPHKYEFEDMGRPIFISFVGSLTHPVRKDILDWYGDRRDCFVSIEPTSLHSYCYILSQSRFVACPRGYGKTSFRIQEALQYGARPIYFSDEHLFTVGCVLSNLEGRFTVDDTDCNPFHCRTIFKNHYTYEAVANRIYENL